MEPYLPKQRLMSDYEFACATLEMLQARYQTACIQKDSDGIRDTQRLLDIAYPRQKTAAIALADEYMNHFQRK